MHVALQRIGALWRASLGSIGAKPYKSCRRSGKVQRQPADRHTTLNRRNSNMDQTTPINGRVIAVRGAVVDVAFEGAALPPIDDALVIN